MKRFSIQAGAIQAGIALALATAVTATPAAAESVSIEWRDLNLDTVQGQRTLDRRIDKAAEQMCGVSHSRTGSRMMNRDMRNCLDTARKSARKQVAQIREETRLGG